MNLVTTNTLLLLGFLSNESFLKSWSIFYRFKTFMASCYCATLFCWILQHQSLSTLQNRKKHGSTSLLTAVHHPPLDTTVWMDISRNPGPISEIISNGWGAQAKRKTILNNGQGMLLNIPSLVDGVGDSLLLPLFSYCDNGSKRLFPTPSVSNLSLRQCCYLSTVTRSLGRASVDGFRRERLQRFATFDSLSEQRSLEAR